MLVLTSFSDRPRIMGALEAGASGYLLKDVEADEVAEGIRAAARGESPLDPRAARTVLTARAEPDPLEELSAREREVLGLLLEGLPNKLIARRLEITEKTVKSHLTRIFREIGVTDRTQAALWAERHGLGPGAPRGAAEGRLPAAGVGAGRRCRRPVRALGTVVESVDSARRGGGRRGASVTWGFARERLVRVHRAAVPGPGRQALDENGTPEVPFSSRGPSRPDGNAARLRSSSSRHLVRPPTRRLPQARSSGAPPIPPPG